MTDGQQKPRRFRLNAHRIAPVPIALGVLAGGGAAHAAALATNETFTAIGEYFGYSQTLGNVLTNGGGTPPLVITGGTGVHNLSHGHATLSSNGLLAYSPYANACATVTDSTVTDVFAYSVHDSSAPQEQFTNVMVTIDLVPPIVPDTYITLPNTAVSGNVRNNDLPTGNTLPVISFTNPSHGTVSLDTSNSSTNGQFNYTPNAGFTGVDTFTYSVNPRLGGCIDTTSVTINVSPLTSAPATSRGVLGLLAALLAWFGLRRRREE